MDNKNLKNILLRKLDSFLNPNFENFIIRKFLSLGSGLILIPTIIAAVKLTLHHGETTFTAEINNSPSLFSMALGVFCILYAAYCFQEKRKSLKTQQLKQCQLDQQDKKSLLFFLENMSTDVIEQGIERSESGQMYMPVLHYFDGLDELLNSATFKVRDTKLESSISHFYHSFSAYVSHSEIFTDSSHPNLKRIFKDHEVHDPKWLKNKIEVFQADLKAFSESYKTLISDISEKYPEIDFDETNKIALDDYQKYQSKDDF
ncbi:hypothetical protein [Pseudoalteromonas spongiae]|uniref:hypothetical protein n=1 Tax=Pseudoalteromonas spongiae TaxID=298657 RepID=UPI000C2D4AB1|nr:hypothetical protein [Pseudoalteromonas spongiae]